MNKKYLWRFLTLVMVAFLGICFTACGDDDDDDGGSGTVNSNIVGTWVAHSGKRTASYTFNSNGKGTSSYSFNGSSGYWSKGGGNFNWSFSGNKVILKGGHWSDVNVDGETDEGTYNETFEYNGNTLTGGRFADCVYYKQ